MHLDVNGFPVQADGITDDTLNRTATLALTSPHWTAQMMRLEVAPGIFVRALNDVPRNVSGDQLMHVFAVAITMPELQQRLNRALVRRLGFSQNTHTMHSDRKKIPDFLFFRTIMFQARYQGSLIPRWFADLFAVLNIVSAIIPWKFADNALVPHRKGPEETDSAIHAVNMLWAIMNTRPSWVGKLAVRLYAWGRGPALGHGEDNVERALTYYHSAQFLGNPEVGEYQVKLWREAKAIAGVK